MQGPARKWSAMVEANLPADESAPGAGPRRNRRKWLVRALLALSLGLAAALFALWINRDYVATGFIDDRLAEYDISVTYNVERISGRRQVLTDIVVGSPARPDLTIDRLEVDLVYRIFGLEVGRLRAVRPRLWGEAGPDGVSFGSLDAVLFGDRDEEGGLPDLDIAIIDGRARIDTPWGPIGVKAEGEGRLSDTFSGMLAANAPRLVSGDCTVDAATIYGRLTLIDGDPRISGPLRLDSARCNGGDTRLAEVNMPVVITARDEFSSLAATFEGRIGELSAGSFAAGLTDLSGRAELAGNRLVGRYEIQSRDILAATTNARRLVADGSFRSGQELSGWDVAIDGTAEGLALGNDFDGQFDEVEAGVSGTLLAPLVARLSNALRDQLPGSQLRATARYRADGGPALLTVPRAVLTGKSGNVLASISRGSASFASAIPRISGNFATGGPNLPRIEGRMEQAGNGQLALTIAMAEYGAGANRLAIPAMTLRQSADGSLAFDGRVLASGVLPGGRISSLVLPVNGQWNAGRGLSLWDRCFQARFDRLVYANLELGRQALDLCPVPGKHVLQAGAAKLRIAAGTSALDLAGTFGGTQLRIASGPVGFAWPGTLTAKALNVQLGPRESGVNFAVSDFTGQLGSRLSGRFEGADILLASVPLDILSASGNWKYQGNVLSVGDGAFMLEDREEKERFEPLVAQGASLTLADGVILADAILRTPVNEAEIMATRIRHDLAGGTGFADLDVSGITFGSGLQPTDLTDLALGVVANVDGRVTGNGRIDWNADVVTSTGSFSSNDLDLAAAFGPVEGVSGTIVFDDLLGLTTAPEQRLSVRSLNPGIEVFDGTVQFALTGGEYLDVQGGSWPFLGGTLEMQPVAIRIGASEVREYIFTINGLEASQLLERLELANFSADGTFDGRMQLVFDEIGNGRIENGQLAARAPGGNFSYVGELTYEDLSPIANFAFDALRSLKYEQMVVGIDGPLTGEILTRVRFDGVTQGEGAKRNFVTRRLASLPIRFNVNIRAPFYQLLTNIRSIYDPAYVRDPREIGLVDDAGGRLRPSVSDEDAPARPPDDLLMPDEAIRPDDTVQTPDSEIMR
ncbi:YdbH domain-containing protein [Erythrobacteraceae bacterium WH01K]|nr:YdbH domain-containing protein [Erythrobacteraceae bacterium WH01K]